VKRSSGRRPILGFVIRELIGLAILYALAMLLWNWLGDIWSWDTAVSAEPEVVAAPSGLRRVATYLPFAILGFALAIELLSALTWKGTGGVVFLFSISASILALPVMLVLAALAGEAGDVAGVAWLMIRGMVLAWGALYVIFLILSSISGALQRDR
jgi:hypothetical protein